VVLIADRGLLSTANIDELVVRSINTVTK
jgi:hypothetical protein